MSLNQFLWLAQVVDEQGTSHYAWADFSKGPEGKDDTCTVDALMYDTASSTHELAPVTGTASWDATNKTLTLGLDASQGGNGNTSPSRTTPQRSDFGSTVSLYGPHPTPTEQRSLARPPGP